MAISIENKKCSAWVIMGNAQAGANLPCRACGDGQCLLQRRTEAGLNCQISIGECLADNQQNEAVPAEEAK